MDPAHMQLHPIFVSHMFTLFQWMPNAPLVFSVASGFSGFLLGVIEFVCCL